MDAAVEPPQANLIRYASIASVFLMSLQASGLGLVSSEAVQEIIDIFKGDTVEDLVDDGIITGYDEVLTTEQIKDKLGTSNSNTSVKVNLDAFKTRYTQSWGAGGTVVKLLDTVFQLKEVNGSINDALINIGNLINDVANKGYITFNQVWQGITSRISIGLEKILESFKASVTEISYIDLVPNGFTVEKTIEGTSAAYGMYYNNYHYINTWNINLPGYYIGLIRSGVYTADVYIYRTDGRPIGTVGYQYKNYGGFGNQNYINIETIFGRIDIPNRLITVSKAVTANKTVTADTPYVKLEESVNVNTVDGYNCTKFDNLDKLIEATNNNESIETNVPSNSFINNKIGTINNDNVSTIETSIDSDTSVVVPKIGDYEIWVKRIIDAINNNEGNGTITDVTNTYINNYAWPTTVLQPDIAIPGTYPLDQVDDSQPFVTPRPDVTAEDAENTVYLGSVPQAIKERFPFSIPWDLYNAFHGLASVQRQAPHIHWDFEAGRWGKLGEVDIDLSDFDSVARLCRNLELLGYIVGLILATRGLIGN